MNTTDTLLRAILAAVSGTAFPASEIAKIVCPTASSSKQLLAYNMCDGVTAQSKIAEELKLNSGNFSRTVSRWVEAGIIVRMGDNGHPLHLYPINKQDLT